MFMLTINIIFHTSVVHEEQYDLRFTSIIIIYKLINNYICPSCMAHDKPSSLQVFFDTKPESEAWCQNHYKKIDC